MSVARSADQTPWSAADAVAWHDIECGPYQADLPLWRELAELAPGPVLDVGAGTGRVALDLARQGHAVIALDRDADLLQELRRRAQGLPVTTVCADARELSLPGERRPGLCLVPMQTLQLLGGAEGRGRFLAAARAQLRPGALLAAAIVEDLDVFDTAQDGGRGPAPDHGRVGDLLYVSRPTAVRARPQAWLLERERVASGPAGARRAPDAIALDRVSRRRLEREARAAGLGVEAPRTVAATSDHVASTVVMLRA
jgi:SAM-dependent methyltransferase